MNETTTHGIRIRVEPAFVPERSNASARRYFFAYTITITNEGTAPAQLISRRWVITDGLGHVERVRGPGVVGKQPHLRPGQSFRYTSFCPLATAVGSMEGGFQMVRDDGSEFEAAIAPFTLAAPHSLN